MRTSITHSRRAFFASVGLTSLSFVSGCMEDNNAEFLKNAPPAPPDPLAGLSFPERRAATQKAAEEKRKLDAEKTKGKKKSKKA